jgi:hypothetical protein
MLTMTESTDIDEVLGDMVKMLKEKMAKCMGEWIGIQSS